MTGILAIDAAWTSSNPSGVAVLEQSSSGWHCRALAPSYESFLQLAEGEPVDWNVKARGSKPDAGKLIETANSFLRGSTISLITIDMPISTIRFSDRRAADQEVSKAFGGRGCATHTPSEKFPGKFGREITDDFVSLGFRIATAESAVMNNMIIEVYPHPAILTLLDADYRIQYKIGKAAKYWPELPIQERKEKLLRNFRKILKALKIEINDIPLDIPSLGNVRYLSRLKNYEDGIDALVCGWVGMKYLDYKALPYGDETAAIWIP